MDTELKQMEKVQRIIALKRYEQPPPGYFHLLPSRIINRIEKGEGKSRVWETWFSAFTIRPFWACAFGLSVCGVATLGIFCPPQSDLQVAASDSTPAISLWANATPVAEEAPAETESPRGLHLAGWQGGGSTDPVTAAQTTAVLFDSREALAMPALFRGN